MIRILSALAGLVFAGVVLLAFVMGATTWLTEEPMHSADHEFHLDAHGPEGGYSFDGPVGKWDVAQLQRGLKVYSEVCAACHSLKFVAFRDLEQIGYSEAQVKAFAATKQVPGIDPNTGESTMRPGEPTDYFPSPFPNAVAAAAANNNAIPPDLSLMTKARHHGSNYVYSLLTGYTDPATFEKDGKRLMEEFPDFQTPPGLYFNPYFANLNLAMAPPLGVDGQVTYDDGTEATVSQMSADVAAFLTWTAEPKLVERKQTGFAVLVFLLFATVLAYFAKRQVWSSVKPKKA
ncbi:cytochrome c1 [Citromicrobium bathyomarinum]|uniref:cytochrome c1 n=1 Tax=unclassified Citromicrobium TaxID=2630544 RepID=UPI0006C902BD|nr:MULTISPECIES: cytochrome c1 [unclassified Citromicrobium]KPM21354.1 cytochrome C [Citromicrobium sp. RCC1885]KPM29434.1 cytochrome C [Citromicrobium sp. RCC1878]MAO04989.1 cytochrome c1 [Citromicrobium sp.]OAM06702.1 cytochrome C [Citromicrobium sp. RCC1897]|tara:strand:- start:7446 stop:8315 length:870 start_codon:yes stop_codon:yes gene_type:complete